MLKHRGSMANTVSTVLLLLMLSVNFQCSHQQFDELSLIVYDEDVAWQSNGTRLFGKRSAAWEEESATAVEARRPSPPLPGADPDGWTVLNVGVLMASHLDSPFDLERCGPAVDLALERVNKEFLQSHRVRLRKVQGRCVCVCF